MPISTYPRRQGRGGGACSQRWWSACPWWLWDTHGRARAPVASCGRAGLQGSVRVSAQPEPEPDAQVARQFAVLLNHLFATRLTPEGRPYTLTEVSHATGLSVPYLSLLRKGTIGAVSLQRAEALARFFQVSLDYFRAEEVPVEPPDTPIQEALGKPLVREVALRAGKVGLAQRALILQMLEHAEQVLQELTRSAAPPSAEAHQPPSTADEAQPEASS